MATIPENPKKVDEGDRRVRMLVALNACGYFDDETAVQALQAMSETPEIDLRIGSTREMLDWLIQQGFVDAQAAQAVADGFVKRLEAGDVPDGIIPHASFVEEIDPRFRAPLAAFVERRRRKMKRVLIAWAAAIPVVIAAGFGVTRWLGSTPLCTADSTKKALMWIGFKSEMELKRKMPALLLKDNSHAAMTFENESEVGYDDSDSSRGCTAIAKSGDDTSRVGYVIRPSKEGKNEFEVRTYPYEYVTARYSPAGLNKLLGAPLGRQAIHDAMMKGVSGIDGRVKSVSPNYGKPSPGSDEPMTMESSVIGVMPAADCRAIDARQYACPVLIDYKDPLLEAIGAMPFVQLKGEFAFARDGDGWKVADGFDQKFLETLVNGRVRNVFGPDVADKMGAASGSKEVAR